MPLPFRLRPVPDAKIRVYIRPSFSVTLKVVSPLESGDVGLRFGQRVSAETLFSGG